MCDPFQGAAETKPSPHDWCLPGQKTPFAYQGGFHISSWPYSS